MNEKIKQYPIFKYLFCLLLVGVLFTSVTFSRYTSSTSGDVNATIGQFIYSYEINNISSTSFANADYWISGTENEGNPSNATRTINFRVSNREKDSLGQTTRVSGVDLQSSIRFYAPAEFAGNLAMQVLEVVDTALVPRSPQYVIGNMIFAVTEENGKYVYKHTGTGGPEAEYLTREFANYDAETPNTVQPMETSKFVNYGELPHDAMYEETLTLSGGLTGNVENSTASGQIRAVGTREGGKTGCSITISASTREVEYSVGVSRSNTISVRNTTNANTTENETGAVSPVYLDIRQNLPYLAIEIALPELVLETDAEGKGVEKEFVLAFTTVGKIDLVLDEKAFAEKLEGYFEDPKASTPTTAAQYDFQGGTVIGYHIDSRVPFYKANADGSINIVDPVEEYATLRMQKRYDFANGGATYELFHLRPSGSDPDAVATEHAIPAIVDGNDPTTALTIVKTDLGSYRGKYGTNRFLPENSGKVNAYRYISIGDITDSPYYSCHTNVGNATRDYSLGKHQNKNYTVQLAMLFTQAEEQGGSV